jgi:hypothetical protein
MLIFAEIGKYFIQLSRHSNYFDNSQGVSIYGVVVVLVLAGQTLFVYKNTGITKVLNFLSISVYATSRSF